jgi:hypothetical protein
VDNFGRAALRVPPVTVVLRNELEQIADDEHQRPVRGQRTR